MEADFSDTNTEEIDKLVVTITELRTTIRICLAVIGFGFLIMLALLTFLVVQSFSTASKVERLTDQVAAIRSDYARLADRMDRIERPRRP